MNIILEMLLSKWWSKYEYHDADVTLWHISYDPVGHRMSWHNIYMYKHINLWTTKITHKCFDEKKEKIFL